LSIALKTEPYDPLPIMFPRLQPKSNLQADFDFSEALVTEDALPRETSQLGVRTSVVIGVWGTAVDAVADNVFDLWERRSMTAGIRDSSSAKSIAQESWRIL
jgi:hypothetical protein